LRRGRQRSQIRASSNRPPERSFDAIKSSTATDSLVAPPSPTGSFQVGSYPRAAPKVRADTPADPAIAPVPFVDDKGQAILDDKGKQMMRPAGLDPHFFVSQGLKDKEIMDTMRLAGDDGGQAAASAYLLKQLYHFQRGHSWDAQRVGGSNRPEFVDYATVAIGLYASAVGLSKDEILPIEDLVARGSVYERETKMDPHLQASS
jgi:hypothetical protein